MENIEVDKNQSAVRYVWVDWSKFICITLMILCHAGMWGNGYKEYIAQLIYSFHMPAFFVISGFLYKPRLWWNTVKSFFWPILIFSTIKFIELVVLQYITNGSVNFCEIVDFNTFWCNSTGHKTLFTGQWFIFALIGCRFFMGDVGIFKILGKFYWGIGILCAIYVFADNYWGLDNFFKSTYLYNAVVAMPFFTFGIYLKKHRTQLIENSSIKYILFITLVAILICALNGRIDMNQKNYGNSIVLFYINAIVASLSLFMWTSRCKQFSIISLFSIGTLVLLGSHMILYKIIAPCLHVLGIYEGGMVSIISTFFILLLNYPLILFAQKKAKWILGK